MTRGHLHRSLAAAAGWAALAAAVLAVLWLAVSGAIGTPVALAEPDRDDVREAERQLRELETRHQRAVEDYLQAESRLADLNSEIEAAEARLDELAARAEARADSAETVVRDLYTGRSAASAVSLLEAGDVAEAGRRAAYLEFAERGHRAAIESYRSAQAEVRHETDALETARAEAAELQEELAAQAERIDAEVAAQEDELGELRRQVAEREARERRERRAREQAAAEQRARERARQVASNEGGGGAASPSSAPEPAESPPPSDRAAAAVDAAMSQRGKPYQWGATGPDSYDCSGLTQWAWRQAGVQIPRTTRQQYAGLPNVSRGELRPGDLVFFGNPIHHMGMYIGDGQMVEAPYTGEVVRVNDINRSDYAGAARPGG